MAGAHVFLDLHVEVAVTLRYAIEAMDAASAYLRRLRSYLDRSET